MELNEIKKILQEEKTKIIIAGEDGPTMVVMSYDDYRKMKGSKKEEVAPSAPRVPRELEKESLKIDDLPF